MSPYFQSEHYKTETVGGRTEQRISNAWENLKKKLRLSKNK